MMTNKEHDDWKGAFQQIPSIGYLKTISNSLRRANAITITKELHELGLYSDEVYAEGLSQILEVERFERPTREDINGILGEKETDTSSDSDKRNGHVDMDAAGNIPWDKLFNKGLLDSIPGFIRKEDERMYFEQLKENLGADTFRKAVDKANILAFVLSGRGEELIRTLMEEDI